MLFDQLKRREFITLLGGAAAAWPLAARAQQRARLPTVGVLGGATPATWSTWLSAFIRRLAELGWIEGHTIAIEYRWAEGNSTRAAEFAGEFVRLKVDVILTAGGVLAAVKSVTSVTPIVFAAASDPIGAGFAASLARPGGNLTGLSLQTTDHAAKRVEILRELMPAARRLAILANSSNPGIMLEVREAETAARTFGFQSSTFEIRRSEDIAPAFEAIKGRADVLYVCTDVLVNINRVRINTLALGAGLPTIYGIREYAEAGGLMSYGANITDLFRRAAEYVDKILRGAKPAELPIEQPTKFELVVNLTTAKTIGLSIPPDFLARADEVIE
jgi:putative tryptophan/tyrosine transport system substrate-binding protein